MTNVSIRELRNHGGDVVDRGSRGEAVTITRVGKPVAELRPGSRQPLATETC
jgi:prevent-host-death family protein